MPTKRLIVFLSASTLFITFVFYGYQIVYTPNVLVEESVPRGVIIDAGLTFADVQRRLSEASLINDMLSFSFLARLRNYDEHILPGYYVLMPNMTNLQVLRLLESGSQTPVRVTYTHARLIDDLGDQITQKLAISSTAFYEGIDRFVAAQKKQGGVFNEFNVISIFIPNTYEIYYTISAKGLVDRMYKEYRLFWNDERKRQAERLQLTPLQVAVLASIVQAETKKIKEAPIVAGLYLNRLRQNMPLQADPTLIFAHRDFSIKRVLNKHKKIESPYNTYRYRGLPPGPINMPSIAMIDAVLNAREHNYLYMCAKDDFSGYHHFSSSLRQHNIYARRYQRAFVTWQRNQRN